MFLKVSSGLKSHLFNGFSPAGSPTFPIFKKVILRGHTFRTPGTLQPAVYPQMASAKKKLRRLLKFFDVPL